MTNVHPSHPRRTSPLAYASVGAILVCYVVVEAIAGAARSPLVPVQPAGVRTPGWTSSLAGWFGLRRAGVTALTGFAVVAIALACACLALLLVEAWRGRVGTGVVMVAAVGAMVLVLFGPLLLSRDATSYAAYGRMLALHGANPYLHAPASFPHDATTQAVSREWLHTRSVYGPLFTLISAGIAQGTRNDLALTGLLFRLLAAIGSLGAAWSAALAVRAVRPGREAFALAAVALNPVVVVHTVGGGHNDALMALFAAAAAWTAVVATRRTASPWPRSFGALVVTFLLTCAVLVKAVALILLALWLVQMVVSDHRPRSRMVGLHVAVIAGTCAVFFGPFLAGAATLHPIVGAASRQGWASPAALVARLIARPGGSSVAPAVGALIKGAFAAVFVALATIVVRRAMAWDGEHPGSALLTTWGPLTLLLALTVPYLLPWYAMWFLPLLPLADERRDLVVGLLLTGLLALTGIPAEPRAAPNIWHDMVSGVHYGAATVALVFLVLLTARILRQPAGAMTTSRSPKARA